MVENRLAHERSSYLRSAAHQPVDWFPWGEEAFRKAKSEDKPILLDIGAVWCHWCHVIDRESYEDPEVARIINDRYVAVKVDRDERPDVDARYQQAVQALRGQGGWPLTAFLTPEGKVFYGGTYFPPEERHGLPAFRTVLAAVADHYRTKKAEARKEADSLHRALSSRLPMAGQEPLDEGLLFAVEEQLTSSFDPVHGGFNGAPKFPHAGTIEFLLARYWRSRKEPLKEVVTKTLREMALGGVYDQIGGGFHRYSVDARWIVPHFEKMAYDNAALLENYVHAYMLTGEPLFRDTALGILRWVDTTLSDRDCGGFYASQDADVGLDDDGDYFTWTLDELREALPEDAARVLARHYDVQKVGEMKERPARNVLWVDEGPGMIAKALGLSEEEVRATIRAAKERLLAARNSRPVPFVDRAIYANWNGMFTSSYLTAAAGLNVPAPREFALRTLDYLLQTMYSKDRGFAHQLVDGEAHVHGLLDDQVQMTRALLAAYEATGDPKYLEAAESVAGLLRTHWWDEVLGGFFDLAPRLIDDAGAETLKAPYKPVQDAPTPAPNAVAALVFGKLHAITGDETYRETQEGLLRTFAAQSRRYGGLFAGTFFLAVDAYVNPPAHVVVTGSRDDEAAVALHAAALSTYHPGRSVVFADGGHVPEAARAMMDSPLAKDGPVAFVCKGTACAPPTGDPEALRKILSTP